MINSKCFEFWIFRFWICLEFRVSDFGFSVPCTARHIANLRLAFLPSSLTKLLPFTLVYSTNPPVSVFGTEAILLALEVFPGTLLYFLRPAEAELRSMPWTCAGGICLPDILSTPTSIQ